MRNLKLYESFMDSDPMSQDGQFDLIGMFRTEDMSSAFDAIDQACQDLGINCMWNCLKTPSSWRSYVRPGDTFAVISDGSDLMSTILDPDGTIRFGPVSSDNKFIDDRTKIDDIQEFIDSSM